MAVNEMSVGAYLKLVSEKAFMGHVIEMAEAYGWTVWHDHDSRRNAAGFPDLVCMHPAYGIVWIELKTETGYVRKGQREFIALIRRCRGRAFVARPRHRDALERLFQGHDVPDSEFELVKGGGE